VTGLQREPPFATEVMSALSTGPAQRPWYREVSREQWKAFLATFLGWLLDGFDFTREYHRALAGGVTTVYLSPGRARLLSGQGSVVKLFGDDIVQRVLAESGCLRINMGPGATSAPAIFEPTPTPTADNPLEPARKQAASF